MPRHIPLGTSPLPAEMATVTEHEDYCLQEYKHLFSPEILQGKVALVTGGGSGIGFRIAELFMRHGCDTVIASRKMNKLEEVRYRGREVRIALKRCCERL